MDTVAWSSAAVNLIVPVILNNSMLEAIYYTDFIIIKRRSPYSCVIMS